MFTIYGDYLRSGHCEVHPWVHEPYPCPVCIDEAYRKDAEFAQLEAEQARYYEELEREHWQEVYEDHLADIGYDPIAMGA